MGRRNRPETAENHPREPARARPRTSRTRLLLAIGTVAAKLGVSEKLVRRLADRGAMPKPIHLSRLVRWRRIDIDVWVQAGCPATRRSPKS